jgi:hypothetical protein
MDDRTQQDFVDQEQETACLPSQVSVTFNVGKETKPTDLVNFGVA